MFCIRSINWLLIPLIRWKFWPLITSNAKIIPTINYVYHNDNSDPLKPSPSNSKFGIFSFVLTISGAVVTISQTIGERPKENIRVFFQISEGCPHPWWSSFSQIILCVREKIDENFYISPRTSGYGTKLHPHQAWTFYDLLIVTDDLPCI